MYDYIAELRNVPFVSKGTEQVNGVFCKVWEKSKKIDPIMNVYVKVQLDLPPFTEEDAEQPEEENQGANDAGDMQGSRATINLTIGDPFMTVNGNRLEIDPGRGTKVGMEQHVL